MDLSKLSVEDLQAVARGDMSKVSDAGLRILAGKAPAAAPVTRENFPSGYATPEAQRALVEGGVEAGTAPVGDRINPVPGYVGPTAIPQVDPETVRMMNDPRRQRPAVAAPVAAAPEPFATGGAPTGEFDTGADPSTATGGSLGGWRGTVYGIGGGIAGGAVGLFGGPVGAAIGGTAGSALGTYAGTFQDLVAEGKSEDEAMTGALKAAGIDIAFNVGGGLVLKVGGKLIGTFLKGSDPWAWVMSKLPKNAADKLRAKPVVGETVFDTTTQDQLERAAVGGAQDLQKGGATVAPGQLTGQAGILESATRQAKPGDFKASELVQKRSLESEIRDFRATLGGDAQSEFPGTALRQVLEDTEARVKEFTRPIWQRLANSRGIEIVDASNMRDLARQMLASKDTFGAMSSQEQTLLRKIAAGKAKISPAEAQDVQSRFFARARDLESSSAPDSPLKGLYDQMASLMRGNLDSALENAVRTGGMAAEDLALIEQARTLYRTMNEKVYSPYLKAARRDMGDEKVAGAVVKPGDVSSVRALAALEDFARDVDSLGQAVFKGAPGEPARQASSAARDVTVAGARPNLPVPSLDNPRELSVFVRQAEAAAGGGEAAAAAFKKANAIPDGRPLRDVAREALDGVRANFFEKYAGTPEALARLHQKMADPDFKRTFDALFPAADAGMRQSIERLSQAAQIWERRNVASSTAGTQALAADVGRRALGPVAATVSRAIAVMTPRFLADNYTKPGFTKFASWVLGAAAGNVGKVPAYVYDFIGPDSEQ